MKRILIILLVSLSLINVKSQIPFRNLPSATFVNPSDVFLFVQGTLATGTTSGKIFVIRYLIQTTTAILEISRTAAM